MSAAAFLLVASLALGQAAPANDFARAVALQQAGDREGAVAAYRAFLNAHPSNVEARSNLGVVLAQLGRFTDAIEAYRAALAIDAKQPRIRLNLGIALYKTANFADAYDRRIAEGLVPQGRWGETEDVGRVVAALARGDAAYKTGAEITVDGGFSIPRL